MFLIKKIVSMFLMPEVFCLILIIIGIILSFSHFKKWSRGILITGTLLLILFSNTFVANMILKPLEFKYSKFSEVTYQQNKDIKYIVVLGGGNRVNHKFPDSSGVSDSTLFRLTEGALLHKKYYPNSKIITSGFAIVDGHSEASSMKNVLTGLEVKESDIIQDSVSRDTIEQGQFIKAIVNNKPFILVTSAAHMPRSIAIFRHNKTNPIPAPTDFISSNKAISVSDYFINSQALFNSDKALHEYFGLLWLKVKGIV